MITLISLGICMLLVKIVGVIGNTIGFIIRGIGILITLPFRLIGYAVRRL